VGSRAKLVPWEAGRKALAPGHKISSPPCPRDLAQPAVHGEREEGKLLFGCPMAQGAPELVPLPPRCGWLEHREAPPNSGCRHGLRAASITTIQSCPGRASKRELDAKAPLYRVHLCARSGNARAVCKSCTFSLKDEKSLGELGKVA